MIERKIYQDGLLVVTKCSGIVSTDELVASEYWMVDNFGGKVKQGFSQVFDALDADVDAITENDIHRVAQINLSHSLERGHFTMAILAVKPYPLALAKLHRLLSAASNIDVENFSDIDAAYKWLGVDGAVLIESKQMIRP